MQAAIFHGNTIISGIQGAIFRGHGAISGIQATILRGNTAISRRIACIPEKKARLLSIAATISRIVEITIASHARVWHFRSHVTS